MTEFPTIIPTPAELRKEQETNEKGWFIRSSNLLVKALEEAYSGPGSVVNTTLSASTLNDRVISRLKKQFEAKGWTLHFSTPFIADKESLYPITIQESDPCQR